MVTQASNWRPHRQADDRRASAIALAHVVVDAEGLTTAHRREALSLAIWKFTEADGKWNTRYRSAGAVGVGWRFLNHEHVVTRRVLIDRLLADPCRCAEIMASAVGCCVLRDEHRRLSMVEREHPGVDGWERYCLAGLTVIDLSLGVCKLSPDGGPPVQ